MSNLCLPGDDTVSPSRRTTTHVVRGNNDAAVAATAAAALLNIAAILASKLETTDNTGPVLSDQHGYGTKSREQNRMGLLKMQEGKFSEARDLFLEAAANSNSAGNFREEDINKKNATIASIEGQLQSARTDLKDGKYTIGNMLLKYALKDAQVIGDKRLQREILNLNKKLVEQGKTRKKGEVLFDNNASCSNVNGEMICE